MTLDLNQIPRDNPGEVVKILSKHGIELSPSTVSRAWPPKNRLAHSPEQEVARSAHWAVTGSAADMRNRIHTARNAFNYLVSVIRGSQGPAMAECRKEAIAALFDNRIACRTAARALRIKRDISDLPQAKTPSAPEPEIRQPSRPRMR